MGFCQMRKRTLFVRRLIASEWSVVWLNKFSIRIERLYTPAMFVASYNHERVDVSALSFVVEFKGIDIITIQLKYFSTVIAPVLEDFRLRYTPHG